MGDPTRELVDELCSLLDEATILSISSDYDLDKPEEFAAARQILQTIAETVEVEEATGFNPSGFTGDDLAGISSLNEDDSSETQPVAEADLKSNDGFTTATESSQTRSIRSGSSKTSVQESPGLIHVGVLDHLSEDEKVRQLAAMFVSLKEIDVKLTLQKAKGDANLAMDELLNLQWLETTGQRPKGVEGFYVSDEEGPKRKKQARKKGKRASKSVSAKSIDMGKSSETMDHDKDEADNVAFISSCFSLSVSDAMDIYRRNQHSLGASIQSFLDNYLALGLLPSFKSSRRSRVEEEQAKRVPWIPEDYFATIFDTASSEQSAVAVVDALADYFPKPAYLRYHVPYSIAASGLELVSDVSSANGSTASSKWTEVASTSSSTAAQVRAVRQFRATPTDLQEASATKATLSAAARHSYASASSAFRKGKGDPLMRGAAAYYAERARAETASYRHAASVESEFLVDRQSTKDTIDLHGVSVEDGVKIALDRAWRWWDGLGEYKRGTELRIVTGLGRHNPDGKSPLRVRVCKALVADGWMVEVLTGAFLLKGRR
ncbi:hypothetical protein GGS20DRAFT_564809 [Poronia punctata]|nr:hypothetical protein GGS20DRAFT_564809 [Poronia punctata]